MNLRPMFEKEVPRRFRKGIGALVGLLLSAAAGALWPNAVADEITPQEKIESVGGILRRDAPGQPVVEIDVSGNNIGNSVIQFVTESAEVTALDISATRIDDAGLREVLPRLPKLRTLRARGCSVGNDTLATLGGCKDLRILDLTGSQITDAGLVHLSDCAKLEELDLTGTAVTDDGLASVVLPNLRVLKLFATHVRGPGLSRFTSVISLDLRATLVDDAGLAGIAALTNLEQLDLSRTKVVADGLRHLGGMSRLRTLRMAQTIDPKRSWGRTSVLDTAPLADLPNLRDLDLADSVDVRSLPGLAGLSRLERLVLDGCALERFEPDDLDPADEIPKPAAAPPQEFLPALKNLKKLQMSECGIGDEWLASIAQMPAIESLDISQNWFTTAGLERLSGLKTLRQLNLIGVTDLSDKSPKVTLPGVQILKTSDLESDEESGSKPDEESDSEGDEGGRFQDPLAPRAAVSAAGTSARLWIVQAEVEQFSPARPPVSLTLQITHVYNGPFSLLGKTFKAYSSRWQWAGSFAGPPSQITDGPFESGEPGIWFVTTREGRLFYSTHELNLASPFRPAPRYWPYPNEDFLTAKRVAEELASIASAAAEDRLQRLSKAAVDDSELMSELAVRIIARAKKPLAVAALRKLVDQEGMPLGGQVALDESLLRLDPQSWLRSATRQKIMSRWIQHWPQREEGRTYEIIGCICAEVWSEPQQLKAMPEIVTEFLLAKSVPAQTRLNALNSVTRGGRIPQDVRQKYLFALLEGQDDETIRWGAAVSLTEITDLDGEHLARLTALAAGEPNREIRELIEKCLSAHRDRSGKNGDP